MDPVVNVRSAGGGPSVLSDVAGVRWLTSEAPEARPPVLRTLGLDVALGVVGVEGGVGFGYLVAEG
ncbi:hypothetical protein GCM10029976_071960 [Kribbella albertanoniae]